ncbi:hypothetical protein N7540_011732 [Penicillium herquei]|nr:hypothetical protein N7540_011732 [Penicillium herquei]
MRFPPEIMSMIIEEAVDFFAIEIKRFLIAHPRLEFDGFGFCQKATNRNCYCYPYPKWYRFPNQWKREYLHHRARQYTKRPSSFSGMIQSLLSCQSVKRTRKEEIDLTDKIIDAWFLGDTWTGPCRELKPCPPGTRWNPGNYTFQIDGFEAKDALETALAMSAIFRKDPIELQKVIDVHLGHHAWSEDLEMDLLEATFMYGFTSTVQVAAKHGTADIMKIGNFDMVDFIVKECESETDEVKQDLQFDILMQAISSGEVDAVGYALETKGLDMRAQLRRFNYFTPLFQALFECPEATQVAIMDLLLEYGADPLQPHHNTRKIPLEYALMQGTRLIDVVELLWNHEMKVFGIPSLLLSSPARKSYWLRIAVAYRCTPIFDVLLRHGTSSVSWRCKKYTVQKPASTIASKK